MPACDAPASPLCARLQKHRWLPQEREQLGAAGGKYDFAAMDMGAKHREFEKATRDKEAKGRGVDVSVMSNCERAETECRELEERRKTVQKDKETIVKVRQWQSAAMGVCFVCISFFGLSLSLLHVCCRLLDA